MDQRRLDDQRHRNEAGGGDIQKLKKTQKPQGWIGALFRVVGMTAMTERLPGVS